MWPLFVLCVTIRYFSNCSGGIGVGLFHLVFALNFCLYQGLLTATHSSINCFWKTWWSLKGPMGPHPPNTD